MTQKFSDAARAELAANINDTDTTISIVEGGGLFPVADTGASAIGPSADWFKLVLQADDGFEIVYVRTHTIDSNTFSDVLRGQDGTTARSFSTAPIPTVVGLRPTAGDHETFRADIDAKAPINSPTFTGTVGGITKAMVGLGNVDNTSDADKPVSTATQLALDDKVDDTEKGAANGVATLDVNGHVPLTQVNPNVAKNMTFSETTQIDNLEALGGSINNTSIGGTTPSTGAFTTLSANGLVEFTDTGAMRIPAGTTLERPVGEAALLRFNGDTAEFEGHNGIEWASVGGSKIEIDSTTDAELYPLFVDATTGTAKVVNVDDQNLTYNPASGRLSAPLPTATNGVFISSATITGDVVIGAGERGLSIDAELADGASLTIEDGGVYVVL